MQLIYHTALDRDTQAKHGIDPVQPFAMADQVRFAELDVLNHVNNGAYMTWFERVRVRYSQIWGVSSYDGGANPRIVLRSANIHYIKEMVMDEDYIVTCRCASFRTNSYTVAQTLWSGGELRARFEAVIVLLKPDRTGKFAIPDTLRQRFETVDGARFQG